LTRHFAPTSTRMNYSQTRPRDICHGFVHDDKDEFDGASMTDHGSPHPDHPAHTSYHRRPPESDSEDTAVNTTPQPPYLATPNCIIISSQVPGDEPMLTGLDDRTGPRVRFRSRVRITGGIGPRRGRSDGLSSSASSISGSPSSSISAPLRTHYTGNNGWVPLGSRIKFVASQPSLVSPCQGDDDVNGAKGNSGENGNGKAQRRSSWPFSDEDLDEHTQLLAPATRYSYVGSYACDSCYDDRQRELERRWREQLIDETFGKWPTRLLNRHVSP